MNHWLTEELNRLTCVERQRELNKERLHFITNDSHANWSLSTRLALKLSDWLINTGERLRRRYEKTVPVSSFLNNQNFVR